MRRLLPLLCALLLVGCVPAPQLTEPDTFSGPLTPRPPGTPDVVIIAVSGRCPPPCLGAPGSNVEYLARRGAVADLEGAVRGAGLSVSTTALTGHLTLHRPLSSGPEVGGFLQAQARLEEVYATLMRGRSNPARVVLLGHSHGTVWTHALVRAHPHIPVALQIDLDGICDFWESDNRSSVRGYVASLGRNPWPFDLSDPCGSVLVAGSLYDLKDVVYPSVALNLEVQSQRFGGVSSKPIVGTLGVNFPFDRVDNRRSDGSRRGIQTFVSRTDDHSQVSYGKSAAMTWVTARVSEIAAAWAGR